VRSGDSDRLESYSDSRIGADRGSTQQEHLQADFPDAQIVLFEDAPLALRALRDGSVAAIVQDGVVLAGLLAHAPDRADFKILPDFLTDESVAVGLLKSERPLLDAVNTTLLDLERSGEAERIYHVWFDRIGSRFKTRDFAIEVPCEALTGWVRTDCPPATLPP
jgi:polar amino acid transport system substrate-binding protein